MGKWFGVFTICIFCASSLAAEGDPNVLITCEDLGIGVVRIGYHVLIEDGMDPGLMRAIALDITTSNAALITGISEYDAEGTPVPADSTQIPDGYSIYMGSVNFAADPNLIADFGDPVAPNTDPDTLGGLGTTGITVEMASLYAPGDPAPPASGTLFKLTLGYNGESDTVLTIAANETRGGCVMENGRQANVICSGCIFPPPPYCWNFDCFDCGDSNGDCVLTFGIDVQAVINAWPATGGAYDPCADFNKDGVITFGGDVQVLINKWPANPQPGHNPGCTDCGPCTPCNQ